MYSIHPYNRTLNISHIRPDQFDSSFYITPPPLFFKFNMKYYTSYKPIELQYFCHVIILNFFVFYSHFLANKIAVLCIFFLSPPSKFYLICYVKHIIKLVRPNYQCKEVLLNKHIPCQTYAHVRIIIFNFFSTHVN